MISDNSAQQLNIQQLQQPNDRELNINTVQRI